MAGRYRNYGLRNTRFLAKQGEVMTDYEEGHGIPQSVIDQATDDVECDRFVAAHIVFPDNAVGS